MEPADRDPALQPERTRLAWRRTTLTCAVVALLAARLALHVRALTLGVVVTAGVVLALALGTFLEVAHRRARMMRTPRPPAIPPRWVIAAGGCAVAIAVFGTMLVI